MSGCSYQWLVVCHVGSLTSRFLRSQTENLVLDGLTCPRLAFLGAPCADWLDWTTLLSFIECLFRKLKIRNCSFTLNPTFCELLSQLFSACYLRINKFAQSAKFMSIFGKKVAMAMTPQHYSEPRRFVFPSKDDKLPIRRSNSSCKLCWWLKFLRNNCAFEVRLGENTNSSALEDYSSRKKKELPPNFAEDVLDLELEMERPKVDIMSVKKLIELYTVLYSHWDEKWCWLGH